MLFRRILRVISKHALSGVAGIALLVGVSIIVIQIVDPNLLSRYIALKAEKTSEVTNPAADESIAGSGNTTGTSAQPSNTAKKSTTLSKNVVTQKGNFVDSTRNGSGTGFTGVTKKCENPVKLGGPRGGDDAIWIKQAILDGMANGKSAFYLDAGTFTAKSQINIGVGIKQLCIEGAGSTKTVFVTPTYFKGRVFDFGDNILSSNNWGLTTLVNRTINSVAEGSKEIALNSNQSDISIGDYAIWDSQQVFNQNNIGLYNAAEIVKVVSYNKATKTATLDQPLGRAFNSTPKIGDINSRISKNITFAGIGLNGQTTSGNWADGLIYTGLATDVRYDDLRVENFLNGAIEVNVCRYCQLTNVSVSKAQTNAVGTGYNILLERSRFILIQNSVADAFMAHMGTMDMTVDKSQGRVDAHGMGEKRITITNCVGRSEITFGNDAWKSGGIGLLVNNCQLTDAYLVGDSKDIVINNSLIGTLILSGGRQSYAVGRIEFNNVTLDRAGGGGSSAIRVYNDNTTPHGPIIFNNSKLNDFTQYWTRLLTFSDPYYANMEFYSCEFETPDNPRATRPLFNIGPIARATKIIVKNSIFKSIDTTAVDIGSDVTSGTYIFENNIFRTPRASTAVFLSNSSAGATVVNSNNQVLLP